MLRRFRSWAAQVGEIKIGDEADPAIALQISGVDTETILENAKSFDNTGNRRRKIRELLFEQLRIEDRDDLFLEHEVSWRGTRRNFQVILQNVRELPTESLVARLGGRKAIFDFPFDEPGHSPADDIARLEGFRESERPSRSLVWIPSFLSLSSQRDLGVLVMLDGVLKSDETFRSHASHLSTIDQGQARELLKNQRSSLRHRMIGYLEGAYGVDVPRAGTVDESHSPAEHFQSLDPSFTPRPPVGASLRQAFEHLCGQMLTSQYPAHPEFHAEAKTIALRKVQHEAEKAAQVADGRIAVDRPLRSLMNQLAVPLKLGEMGETHFVLGRHWYDHFNSQVTDELTVGKLRAAIDRPRSMGLPASAENVVIQLYADQTNRSFFLHGGPYRPKLDDLPDELELRDQRLPSQDVWDEATVRAGKIFGLSASPLLNATNKTDLSNQLSDVAKANLEVCQALTDKLDGRCADLRVDPSDDSRHKTAGAVHALLHRLLEATDEDRIDALVEAEIVTSLDAMGTSLKKATSVDAVLDATKWELFQGIQELTDDRAAAAQGIQEQLVEVLSSDEYAVALKSRLQKLEQDAIRLLAPAPPSPRPGIEVVEAERRQALAGAQAGEVLADLQGKLRDDAALKLDLEWKLYREKSTE